MLPSQNKVHLTGKGDYRNKNLHCRILFESTVTVCWISRLSFVSDTQWDWLHTTPCCRPWPFRCFRARVLSPSLFLCLCLFLSISISVCPSVRPSVCLSLHWKRHGILLKACTLRESSKVFTRDLAKSIKAAAATFLSLLAASSRRHKTQ